MTAKAPMNKRRGKRVSKKTGTIRPCVSPPVSLHRRSRSEFSCGLDLDRALLVEESLDEREKRG